MIIKDLDYKRDGALAGIRATVVWEERNRPEREIYIETENAHGSDLSCNPHAFLVGCLIPALHHGERRVWLDHDICPFLLEGLGTVMGIMKEWSGGRYHPVEIETGTVSAAPASAHRDRAGLFLSGGIDSLAALRINRLTCGSSHPAAVRDCLLVHGFDIGGVVERGMKYHVFERAKTALAAVAEDAGVELIPVYTNIRHLSDHRDLWLDRFFGAVLAAVGHAFSSRMNLVYIASSYDLPNLHPCGSHPMLDPEFSSYDLRIRHRDVALSRMEKIGIVAEWDAAFQNMRVCLANVADRLNCGRCEKCVRTMTGLAAIGALHKTRAFDGAELTPEHFSGFKITIRERGLFYREMLPLLRAKGRSDLVETIERKLAE